MSQSQKALVVRANEQIVEGTVCFDQPRFDRPAEWTGTIRFAEGRRIEPSRCRLEMPDGSCGDIVIYRLDAGSDRSTIAHFRGVSTLRRAS